MSYDVSTLGTHVQTNEKTLLVKSVLTPKTVAKIKGAGKVMTGVKTKSQLPQMDTDAVFQDGKGCGFTPEGTTKISKREVEVGTIKVNEALCPSDVEASFEQMNLTAGSDYTEIIFANDYSTLKTKKIAKALEIALWKGDKASADSQLKRFDGFLKILGAATGVVDGNPTDATEITKANIADLLDAIYEVIPEDIIENDNLFVACGQEVFRAYIMAMRDKNYYKDYALDGANNEVKIIGTNLTLFSTPGLNGTKKMVATHWDNMYFATDLLGEEDQFDLSYATEAEEVRFKAKFKAGVQVAFPEEVVLFKL